MHAIESALPANLQFLYPVLFFPIQLLEWIFIGEVTPLYAAKVLLLFLPVLLIGIGFWTTVVCILMSLFRANRVKFIATILITWWDGGRAILLFWAGLIKFFFLSFGWIFGALRISILGYVSLSREDDKYKV
jgi:hypothetical protein